MTGLSTEIYHDLKGSMSGLVDIFNQQLVPAIQQGAVLTKDYALDLFGRYIQFAIAIDMLAILLQLGLLYVLYLGYKKVSTNDTSYWKENTIMDCAFIGIFVLLLIGAIYLNFTHIIQSIFIPELTIYDKIIELKK